MLSAAFLTLALLQDGSCGADAARHVAEALRLGETFDLSGAADAYAAAAKVGCADAQKAAIYIRGLVAARAADAQFGSAASLQPVRQAITALEPAAAADPVARIMQAVLRAALPAAQHERAELALLIDEMLRRELLQLEAKLPAVPVLSAHEAAGYFWLQLHIYDEAARAFDVAAQRVGSTPAVLLGAARSAARQQRIAVACVQYQRLISWWGSRPGSPPEMTEARAYVKQPPCAAPVPPGARR
jgi:hypothetical protein